MSDNINIQVGTIEITARPEPFMGSRGQWQAVEEDLDKAVERLKATIHVAKVNEGGPQ